MYIVGLRVKLQLRQKVEPDLGPTCLKLWWYSRKIVSEEERGEIQTQHA